MNSTFDREQCVYLWRIFARSYSTYDRELLKNVWTVLIIENKEYVSNAKESTTFSINTGSDFEGSCCTCH